MLCSPADRSRNEALIELCLPLCALDMRDASIAWIIGATNRERDDMLVNKRLSRSNWELTDAASSTVEVMGFNSLLAGEGLAPLWDDWFIHASGSLNFTS